MEKISNLLREIDTKDFMGLDGFVWWYGVVEDRKDPLYLGRVKVRCIGFHTDDKSSGGIPTEDLPWAQVISPIHSSGISGIGFSPTGLMEGSHVFGFFRDGREAQEPVVLGSCVGIPGTIANKDRGFFDPRPLSERMTYPYPPFFIDRYDDGKKAVIVEYKFVKDNGYSFDGRNQLTDDKAFAEYIYDQTSDRAIVRVRDDKNGYLYHRHAWSPNPKEDNMGFESTGVLAWSLPSTPLFASSKIKFQNDNSIANPIAEVYTKTNDLNVRMNEAIRNLHSDIESAGPCDADGNLFNMPSNNFNPEYPFNHINYTESGHIFELDDSPGFERIRLLHRTNSFLEFNQNGDFVTNTVGDRYEMVDADSFSHVIGNQHFNSGGGFNIFVNSRKSENQDFRLIVGNKSNIYMQAYDGDIFLYSNGKNQIMSYASKYMFMSNGSLSKDLSNFDIMNMNFNVSEASSSSQSYSGRFNVKSGDMQLESQGVMISSTGGMFLNSTSGGVTIKALRNIEEVITGISFTTGKSTTLQFGSIYQDITVPLVTDGHYMRLGPLGAISEFSQTTLGTKFFSNGVNGFEVNVPLGPIKFNSLLGVDIADSISIKLSNLIGGQISIEETGLLSLKSGLGQNLKTFLDNLLLAITKITVPTGTGPSGTPLNTSEFTTLQQNLAQLLS